jgi:HEAT repeat protein
VRHEALLDLVALAPGMLFSASDVARVAALARDPKTPATLAPGLVVLLAAIRIPESEPALVAVLQSGADPQTRAAAARVLGKRGGPANVAALRTAQRDRALAVRLTAQRALDGVREP